jgi:hypothetical protein
MNILGAGELPIMQEDTFNEQTAQSNEVFKHGCLHVALITTHLNCKEGFYFKM